MKEIPFPLEVRAMPKDYHVDMKNYPMMKDWNDIFDLLKLDEKKRNEVGIDIAIHSHVHEVRIRMGMPELLWFYQDADVFELINKWNIRQFDFIIKKQMPIGGLYFVRLEYLVSNNVK